MTEQRILLLSSKEAFDKTPRKIIYAMNLVGWYQDNGIIFVEKNRFNGMTGTYSQKMWDKLVAQTKSMFVDQANFDYESLTREELIHMVIRLQDENERLRKQNSDMGWQLNPDRMGGQFTREETERNWDGWR